MSDKYRKKPVVIEAIEYTDANLDKILAFGGDSLLYSSGFGYQDERLEIMTSEGIMRASKGDFVCKGTAGEFYPCKPIPFFQVHERIDDE